MEIVVSGAKLHHGSSMLIIEIETEDLRSDTSIVMRGEVVPAGPAPVAAPNSGVTIDAGLLGR